LLDGRGLLVWVLVPIMGGGGFMTHYLLGLRRDGDGEGDPP